MAELLDSSVGGWGDRGGGSGEGGRGVEPVMVGVPERGVRGVDGGACWIDGDLPDRGELR